MKLAESYHRLFPGNPEDHQFFLFIATTLIATTMKIALIPHVIPQTFPVAIANITIIAALVLWPFHRRLGIHTFDTYIFLGTVLAALFAEGHRFLPFLHPEDSLLSLYYSISVLQVLFVIIFAASSMSFGKALPLLAATLAYEIVLLQRTNEFVLLVYILVLASTVLVFAALSEFRLLRTKTRQTRDLSQRLSAAEQRMLEQERQVTMSKITAGIAHEINNPVNYLRGNVTFLQEDFERLVALATSGERSLDEIDRIDKDAQSILTRYTEGLDRIRDTVRNLKGMFHGLSGERSPSDLNDIIHRVVEYVAQQNPEAPPIELNLEEPLLYNCNKTDMYSLFTNIITNAADATGSKDSIVIRGFSNHEGIHVDVEDTGTGIAPENMDRIFDPFFTTKLRDGKMGIGLALCKNMVSRYAGEIVVESSVNQFTRMTIRLPRRTT